MDREIVAGDLFRFAYSAEYLASQRGDPYWCFDGQLVATFTRSGIRLVDTYWGSFPPNERSDGRAFTPEQARTQGVLTFVCNLGDMVTGTASDYLYYDPSDLVNASHQSGCRTMWLRRKGAQRSQAVTAGSLRVAIAKKEQEIEWARDAIERLKDALESVQDGMLERIYIG